MDEIIVITLSLGYGELPNINIPSTVTFKFTKNPPSKITFLIYIDYKGNQIYSENESIKGKGYWDKA